MLHQVLIGEPGVGKTAIAEGMVCCCFCILDEGGVDIVSDSAFPPVGLSNLKESWRSS